MGEHGVLRPHGEGEDQEARQDGDEGGVVPERHGELGRVAAHERGVEAAEPDEPEGVDIAGERREDEAEAEMPGPADDGGRLMTKSGSWQGPTHDRVRPVTAREALSAPIRPATEEAGPTGLRHCLPSPRNSNERGRTSDP